MGIRENFAQAVKELTGSGKDEVNKTPEKKGVGVEELKRAVEVESADIREDFVPYGAESHTQNEPKAESHIPEELNVGIHELQEKPLQSAPLQVNNQVQYMSSQPDSPVDMPAGNMPMGNINKNTVNQNIQNIQNAGSGYYSQPDSGKLPGYQQNTAVNGNSGNNYNDNEITIISRNTVVDGNIRSFANMSIDGDIKGDVETTKNVDVNGKIVGNVTCNNAEMHSSQIQGNIRMKGNVVMERDTLLIGDLASTYAKVNGKVKGNLDVAGKAELKGDAVVFGDISASTITVDDGAIIQGYVSTTFLNKEESRNIFPDVISIGD